MSRTDTYTVAVTPVVKATSMVIRDAPPPSVRAGDEFLFTGTLLDEDGVPLEGKLINLFYGDNIIATDTTDGLGNWDFVNTIPEAGTYAIYAEFPGDADYTGC